LYGAYFVVDELDRHNAHCPVERRGKGLQVDNAIAPHPDNSDRRSEEAAGRLRRMQHSVVLDRANYDRPGCCTSPAKHGQVGGLGTTTGEHHVARGRPKESGNLVPRLVNCLARSSGDGMGARRVAEGP
jgi:hypothetical protein